MSNNIAYLGLGSNLGDRFNYLKDSIFLLQRHTNIQITSISSIYETKPIGYIKQPKFLNMVIKIDTTLSPKKLLEATQEVETKLERKREIRWGPRTIDIDILIYNDQKIQAKDLVIPHPRIKERSFVLIPLKELGISLTSNLTDDGIFLWKEQMSSYIE